MADDEASTDAVVPSPVPRRHYVSGYFEALVTALNTYDDPDYRIGVLAEMEQCDPVKFEAFTAANADAVAALRK